MDEQTIIDCYSKKNVESLKGLSIALTGKLGAGKTYLVKKILESLSPDFKSQVHSPTFNLCNVYDIPGLEVHHFDLYRIESSEELHEIGVWESLDTPEILVFVEWADMFPEILSACDRMIKINFKGKGREYETRNSRD